MNWNTFIASSLFAVLNVVALSAHADTQPKLDIQRVLSTVDNGGAACGVVNARMTYLDSHGEKRVLDYSKFADACSEGS
jgi:transcription elongation factor Elf1